MDIKDESHTPTPKNYVFESLFKCDDYKIVNSDYDQKNYNHPYNPNPRFYERSRVKYGIKHFTEGEMSTQSVNGRKIYKEDLSPPIMPRGLLHIIEGVEIEKDNSSKIKFVSFTFNDLDFIVPVNQSLQQNTTMVKCPFLIVYKILHFTDLVIKFYDENKNNLGYDFNSWIIGGKIALEIDYKDEIGCDFVDPITNRNRSVRYLNGMLGWD